MVHAMFQNHLSDFLKNFTIITRVVRKVRGHLLLKTQMCLILISITIFHKFKLF